MGTPVRYSDVKVINKDTVKFNDPVFDNFISTSGGIERGTMIALAGTSGAGKTTLCKKWQADIGLKFMSLFFALESLKSSVAKQTKRIKTKGNELICDVEDFPTWTSFMDYLYATPPLMVIVDSLQHAAELMSKENNKFKYENYKLIIKDLYTWKDKTQGIVILICQLNEKGKMEGPAATIFDVDCPIFLTANPANGERFMSTSKNRMGKTGKIFYELTDTDECIKFYTVDEWSALKLKLSISDMVSDTIERYLAAISNHKNYGPLRKEFVEEYGKIYNADDSDAVTLGNTIELIQVLCEKYEII
jgi:predicted ATP-dependent serine protease